ncbi:aromatic ring-hydroxylating dioxygenase subunit alpha [Embleya sp. NPDC050154]|uniref:aromatic ring-hydroxylating dioxygenase subunit alpha n=1 Tax=Embleya sp. NPDC050154 TaxID=3363988 RepID=UPI003796869D
MTTQAERPTPARDEHTRTSPMLVPRRNYTDPGLYEEERVKIFRRTWQLICHTSELPEVGSYRTARIAGEPVAVWRGTDGVIRGFHNACTHRGVEVLLGAKGTCPGSVKCMYHAWAFSDKGDLVGVPFPRAYGEGLDKSEYGLTPVKVAEFAGLVFAAIDPAVENFEDYLGEAARYLREFMADTEVIGRARWDYPGNWKLWTDNFRDNYHPQFLHRMIADGRGGMQPGKNYELASGHSMLTFPAYGGFNIEKYAAGLSCELGETLTLKVEDSASRGHTDEEQEARLAAWERDVRHGNTIFAVFPNFDLQYDADGSSIFLEVATPLGLDSTVVELIILGKVGESAAERKRRLETGADSQGSWGKISADDLEAAVRAQSGLQGSSLATSHMGRGLKPGKVGDKFDEYSLRCFHKLWNSYINEEPIVLEKGFVHE